MMHASLILGVVFVLVVGFIIHRYILTPLAETMTVPPRSPRVFAIAWLLFWAMILALYLT